MASLPRNNHEFLECKSAAGMRSTVEDIHKGDGQDEGLFRACEIRHMDVERDFLER